MMLARSVSRVSASRVEEFQSRLQALIAEFEDTDPDEDEAHTYALTIAFYPSFYFHGSPRAEPPSTEA
jgi:hypothetical protein